MANAVATHEFSALAFPRGQLSVQKRDQLIVESQREDGWCNCANMFGESGIVPSSVVQMLPKGRAAKARASVTPAPRPAAGAAGHSPLKTEEGAALTGDADKEDAPKTKSKLMTWLTHVKYSEWTKELSGKVLPLVLVAQGLTVLYMNYRMNDRIRASRLKDGIDLGDEVVAIAGYGTIVAGFILRRIEKHAKKEGSLFPRFLICALLAAVQMIIAPVPVAGIACLVTAIVTFVALAGGEKAKPWRKRVEKKYEIVNDDDGLGGLAYIREMITRLNEQDRFAQYRFVAIYYAINVVLYYEAHERWVVKARAGGVDDVWVPQAKAFGQLLNFNCTLILLPVLWDFMREINRYPAIDKFVPLGLNVDFHKFVAYNMAFMATAHTFAHYVNLVATGYGKMRKALPTLDIAFFTGIVICICIVLMFSAAQESVRRSCHNAFWFSHHLFCVFWGCLLLHGPVFYIWFAVPGIVYGVYRARQGRSGIPIIVREIILEPPSVLKVVFSNKRLRDEDKYREAFAYHEGMYLKLNCPSISKYEWHPFTISSAPEDEALTVHIKISTREGSWTSQLRDLASMFNPLGIDNFMFYTKNALGERRIGRENMVDGNPLIRIDGPHAAPCQHICEYETVMLTGAGIGLTPFSSTLTSLLKYKMQRNLNPHNMYFYWSFRMSEFLSMFWFVKLLGQLRQSYLVQHARGCKYKVRINLFVTGQCAPEELEDVKALAEGRSSGSNNDAANEEAFLFAEGVQGAVVTATQDYKGRHADELSFSKGTDIVLTSTQHVGGSNSWLHGDIQGRKGAFPVSCVKVKVDNPYDPFAVDQGERCSVISVQTGRPNWDNEFAAVKEVHAGQGDIGVFCCGPMGNDLRKRCLKYGSINRLNPAESTIFKLHAEVF